MSASTPDVSILIVAYQSADQITACLSAIAPACTRYRYEVLLVDNGDGSTAALAGKAFPWVRIIPGLGNIGFAAGNNLLAAQAQAKYLLLANPDLEMHPGAVDALLDGASRYPGAAAWGGVTLDRAGRPDIGNSVHVPSLTEMASRLVGRSNTRLDEDDTLIDDRRVEALSGGFVMFARDVWDEAGGLDESYFLYCEEVDLFYRLSRMGYEFWRIGAARAYHDIGHGDVLTARRMLYRAAGNMQFVRLHWSKPQQAMAFILTWAAAWQRLITGWLLGRWVPRLRALAECHRDMALSPHFWRAGYDPQRGLLIRMRSQTDPAPTGTP